MKTIECPVAGKKRNDCAFTRTDLLAVLVTLAVLALLLFPALAGTHVSTQGTQCLDNLRQITGGWWMYANDSQGKLVPNRGSFPPNPDYGSSSWVAGNMRTTGDTTNSALLVNPTVSYLAAYVRNPALYKCPADQSTWSSVGAPGADEQPRVRSYSMNEAVGCAENGTLQDPGHLPIGHWLTRNSQDGNGNNATAPGGFPFRVYSKESDLVAPSPSQLFLLLDEHPNSIDNASFAVAMPTSPRGSWIDVPAAYHNNGCDFSFADGHVEFHEWNLPQLIPPVVWAADTDGSIGSISQTGTGGSLIVDSDAFWLDHRTSALAPGAIVPYQP